MATMLGVRLLALAASAVSAVSASATLDLNSICEDGGTFFPQQCGPLSSCHRCYYLGEPGQSCDEVCTTVGSSCDSTGTAAMGSLGDSGSCYAVANAMGLDYDKQGTYVGEPVGCAWIGNSPGDMWVQRMVDSTRPTTCEASDPGRSRICSCEIDAKVAPTTLLSDDGGKTCLDIDGKGSCDAFALVEERLVALPDATHCVGMAEDGPASSWALVPCNDSRATRFSRSFGDRYVSEIVGSGTLDRYSAQCAPLDLESIPFFARPVSERGGLGYDLSQYDQSNCDSTDAGENCEVKCTNGYASVNFQCPPGNVDPSQQPLAPSLPLCATNRFIGGDPSLYGVPASDSLRVRAVSAHPGKLWVVVAEMSAGVLETAAEVKGCQAPYCLDCRIEASSTDSFFHELEGCGLVEGASYRLHFYVGLDEDDEKGSISSYEFVVPTASCPVAIEPDGKQQNGRFFWGSCYYVAEPQESCEAFCEKKLSTSCDVSGLLAVGSCAKSADSCLQLVRAMGLPHDEKVGTFGDDSSGCTWYHGNGGANAEFWVQRFVQDRDPSNPTTCDEANGDDSRHRICSCEVPHTFGEVEQKKLISVETGLLARGLDAYSLQRNTAAIDELERVFVDLTGAAEGDASAWIIDAAVAESEPSCETIVPEMDGADSRRLLDDASKIWVYVGANSAGDANHIQLNINKAVESGDLVDRVSNALAKHGESPWNVWVAGTTPAPTLSPTVPPTEQPCLSIAPTKAPTEQSISTPLSSTASPTVSPTENLSSSFAPTNTPTEQSISTPVSSTASPTTSRRYEATGNFEQEFLFERMALSEGEQSAFEGVVASLVPLFIEDEKADFIDTFVSLVRQTVVKGENVNRRGRFRALSQENSYYTVRVQYIMTYVSSRFDVEDYPFKYLQFLSTMDNRKIMEDMLISNGVQVVPGSTTAVSFSPDRKKEKAPEDARKNNWTAIVVGVAAAVVVCTVGVLVGVLFISRKRRRRNEESKVPVVHAVQIDTESQKSSEFVVEAFAVDDIIASCDAETGLHFRGETTSTPEPISGSNETAVASEHHEVVSNGAASVAGLKASAVARREEVRAELNARNMTRITPGTKYAKKGANKFGSTEKAPVSPTLWAENSTQPIPKGPEIPRNISRCPDGAK